MNTDIELSAAQTKLYGYFKEAGLDVDLAIVTLFEQMDVKPWSTKRKPSALSVREKQQHVGSAVYRINKKLTGYGFVIVPGELKKTYRLTTVSK